MGVSDMKGILVLAHGSREKDTENTLMEIISMLKAELEECIIDIAFLQFNEVNLSKGLDKLVQEGVDDIKVIPCFLFDGVHIRKYIPKEIEEYLKDKPHIKIHLGRTIGADERLAAILADRVRELS